MYENLMNPENFSIVFFYEGERLQADVLLADEQCYQIWMKGKHVFTLATSVVNLTEVEWRLVDEDKYVPYVTEIGKAIEEKLL